MSKRLFFKDIEEPAEDANEVNLLDNSQSAFSSAKDEENDLNIKPADLKTETDYVKVPEKGRSSYIEKDVVITGDITSVTDFEVEGSLKGNMSCEGDIIVSGQIDGGVKAANLSIVTGTITGDVDVKGSVTMSAGTVIKGNITGAKIECDGTIEGNTVVTDEAAILNNASINGDITAGVISVAIGAVMSGSLKISKDAAK